MDFAIIGAGLAGLTAARELAEAGHQVTVVDKGRRVGGRLASKDRDPTLSFDHGAQYWTAKDPRFQQEVRKLEAAGVVAAWSGRFGSIESSGHLQMKAPSPTRYVGLPTNQALAAAWARGLPNSIRLDLQTRVDRVERRNGSWVMETTRLDQDGVGQLGPFDGLLVTAPPLQAGRLLVGHPLQRRALECVMDPCWATMAHFPRSLPLDVDGLFVNLGPLSWCARNNSKPQRPEAEAWILHAGPSFSREHLEADPATVGPRLVQAFFDATGLEPVEPLELKSHRWRYAAPQNPAEDEVPLDSDSFVALAGDWLHGGRVEGAYLSGLCAAARMNELARARG